MQLGVMGHVALALSCAVGIAGCSSASDASAPSDTDGAMEATMNSDGARLPGDVVTEPGAIDVLGNALPDTATSIDAEALTDATADDQPAPLDIAVIVDVPLSPMDVPPAPLDVPTAIDTGAPPPPPCTHGVCAVSTISYAPNSFVIGNAYRGWTDTLHGSTVFQRGPGNPTGANYQCGYLYGESFDHCGWLNRATVRGTADMAGCGADCPRTYDTPLFTTTYTNGQISSGAGDGTGTHMHYAGSGCTNHNGYGNVDPWKATATPDNLVGTIPDGRLLLWRYVSRDGNWVMVRDPTPGVSPNWYFVRRGCVSLR